MSNFFIYFFKRVIFIFTISIKKHSMMYDFLESEKKKKMTELHLFEVDTVRKVNFEKKRVKVF